MRRIKPHAPPLVRAPVNSFEFQPCGRTPQAEYLSSSLRHRGTFLPPTPSIHRLQPGLPGYLIPFAPLAFAPQRQCLSRKPPSHRCSSQYLRISPLHWEFRFPLQHSSSVVSQAIPGLSPGLSPMTDETACAPFTPSNSEQRLPPPYYRGCWHGVSRGFLQRYRHLLRPSGQEFTIRKPSSSTRRCWVRVSPIAQNSPLLPPVGVWAVSQSQCGRPSSQTGYQSSPW